MNIWSGLLDSLEVFLRICLEILCGYFLIMLGLCFWWLWWVFFFGVGFGFVIFVNGFIVGFVVGVFKEEGILVKIFILGFVLYGIVEIFVIFLVGVVGMCWYCRIMELEDKGKGFKEGVF